MHIIAAKAVAFKEALQPEFKVYQQQILDNAKSNGYSDAAAWFIKLFLMVLKIICSLSI